MNTIEKGTTYELQVLEAIKNGDIEVFPYLHTLLKEGKAKIYHKKKYYSNERIPIATEFDIAIEIYNTAFPNQYAYLILIECKNYNSKIPIDDVQEFIYKVNKIAEANGKGYFITNSDFSNTTIDLARNAGIGLIKYINRESFKYVLPYSKTAYQFISNENLPDFFIFNEIFEKVKLNSYPKLEKFANVLLCEFNKDILTYEFSLKLLKNNTKFIQLHDLIIFLKSKYNIKIKAAKNFYCDQKNKIVFANIQEDSQHIDKKSSFKLFHEISHCILHTNKSIVPELNNNITVEKIILTLGRRLISDQFSLLEWQANTLTSCLLMPNVVVKFALLFYQQKEGIRNPGIIYLDNQKVNQHTFIQTIDFLSSYFNTSFTAVTYRLLNLGLIKGQKEIAIKILHSGLTLQDIIMYNLFT